MRTLALLMALLLVGACGNGNSQAEQADADTEAKTDEQTRSEADSGQSSQTGNGSTGTVAKAEGGGDGKQANEEKASAERMTPGWMEVGDEKAAFDVVAAWNSQNNGWNFNGYADGEITVVVPEGWRVAIDFTSQGAYPHSLVVIEDPRPDGSLPAQAGRDLAAFTRAYTSKPTQGLRSGKEGSLSFTADEAGDYLWYCGVPGHGPAGMWVGFEVSAEADKPYVLKEPAAEGRT